MTSGPRRDPAPFDAPESRMPIYAAGAGDRDLLNRLCAAIRRGTLDHAEIDAAFAHSGLPQTWLRAILVLYAPGEKRILVSREGGAGFAALAAALLRHERLPALAGRDFRIQLDFIVDAPERVDLAELACERRGEHHFEPGIDGLMFKAADGALRLFLPGDAYVRSIMGTQQLREYLTRAFGEATVLRGECRRFRSLSFVSAQRGDAWLRLYRGHPLVGPLTREKIEHAVERAIGHIRLTQQENGQFLYYYDAALDSRRDHEHPKRDPQRNPYYNILRHGGGALTCLFREKYSRGGDTFGIVRRAIDFFLAQARDCAYAGRAAAYIYSEKKSKLGGAGIALYLLAEYQALTGDARYRPWADKLAWHLLNQITASGEFIYYNIYLDRVVTEAENQDHFSFYYPGEAICGLAKYLHLLAPDERVAFHEPIHRALRYLLEIRPRARADQYTAVPSDSWLMMGIKELWDFEAMRRPAYAEFVFADAGRMIDQLYKTTDAPYPDYAGAFYYEFGDYPYADGARCEGLLGAYELAVAMGDAARARALWPALKLAAWAVMHLVNTEDSVYSARNPALALGGIRFKYTRQWFRIDTIQHVASFYAKMLPHWAREEGAA